MNSLIFEQYLPMIHHVALKASERSRRASAFLEYDDIFQEASIVLLKQYGIWGERHTKGWKSYFFTGAWWRINRMFDEAMRNKHEEILEDEFTLTDVAQGIMSYQDLTQFMMDMDHVRQKLSKPALVIFDQVVEPSDLMEFEFERSREIVKHVGPEIRVSPQLDWRFVTRAMNVSAFKNARYKEEVAAAIAEVFERKGV